MAQENLSYAETEDPNYSKTQVLRYTGFSLGSNALLHGINTFEPIGALNTITGSEESDITKPWWVYATISSHHLSLYALDYKKAITYTGTGLTFLGLHLATREKPYISRVPYYFYLNNEFYSTYEIYKTNRGKAGSSVYPEDWEPHNRKELLCAPFRTENLSHPLFYITILSETAIHILSSALGNEDAIWKTGEAYIDNEKVPIYQAVPAIFATNLITETAVAVGEEALFRGVIYEEFKQSLGSKPAKLIDMILFPALHIAGDLALERSSDEVIGNFILRSFTTLLFDLAYDRGGLPASTALHMWFNTIGDSMVWAENNGVKASSSNNSSSAMTANCNIRFSIVF
jgi:membrane protease YdiL (CAAX protease family)